MELHPFRGLLTVEERSVHGPGCDGGDGDAAFGIFLRRGSGEVLDRTLAAGVGRVAIGERGEQGSDDGDDLAVVGEVLARLLDEEVGGLRVDVEHRVVLVFGGLRNGLAQNLAGRVHRDVYGAQRGDGIVEEPLNVGGLGEISGEQDALRAIGFDGRECLFGLRPR